MYLRLIVLLIASNISAIIVQRIVIPILFNFSDIMYNIFTTDQPKLMRFYVNTSVQIYDVYYDVST